MNNVWILLLIFFLMIWFFPEDGTYQIGGSGGEGSGDGGNMPWYERRGVVFLFWTGGYDSTFRLLQAVIDEGRTVQPVYLTGKIDNCPTCQYYRKNREQEFTAMKNVVTMVREKYPTLGDKILPLVTVDTVPENKELSEVFHRMRLHNFGRRFNQYEAMARLATHYQIPMEIGTVGIEGEGDGNLPMDRWGVYLRKNLIPKEEGKFGVKDPSSPVYYLRFPVAYISKKQMLEIAKKNGYDSILRKSWSCWFPKNGQPCGRCPMCRSRVISHPK